MTQDRLKELFTYDKSTGVLKWKKKNTKGKIAGTLKKSGYMNVGVDKKTYRIHRIIWLFEYGEFPKGQIDHINHIKSDNRIENLRIVSASENCKNRPRDKRNKSGVVGVCKISRNNLWRAQIGVNKKVIQLGEFKYKSEAIKARKKAEIKYKFHKNHGGII